MKSSETTGKETHHHSHSRIRKILDEIDAVVSAARKNEAFESHHRRELEVFLDRLREVFDRHAAYEEDELFDGIHQMLDDAGLKTLEAVIGQHRQFGDQLQIVRSRFEELDVESPTDRRSLRRLCNAVEKLQELWTRHDATEHDLFEQLSEDAPH